MAKRKQPERGLARRVRRLERELRRRDHELARYRADVLGGVLRLLQEYAPLDGPTARDAEADLRWAPGTALVGGTGVTG